VHLVFGATGQLGFELCRVLGERHHVVGVDRAMADFLHPETVVAVLLRHRPAIIWNAAAATQVDALESQPDLAHQVNAETVRVIARTSRELGSVLVHFSTDYVFDGTKTAPYCEDDLPNPLNVYGRSKLAGETAIRQTGGRWAVLRTSWVYSRRGRNFLRTIARKGLESELLRVVDDQIGAPTEAGQLARACLAICPVLLESEAGGGLGLYHVSASGQTSWWGFACAIRDLLLTHGLAWKARIEPISSGELALPARRPANSLLDTTRFREAFGVDPASWQETLKGLPFDPDRWWENSTLPGSAAP
jgi:dTDP-4-dehydrorhamnose reductase